MDKLSGLFNIRKINCDVDTEMAAKYSVRSVPTLILLDGDKEINRITGVQSEEQIKALEQFCKAFDISQSTLHAIIECGFERLSNTEELDRLYYLFETVFEN
jgi:thioredoxin-like negative regulator of GroEL